MDALDKSGLPLLLGANTVFYHRVATDPRPAMKRIFERSKDMTYPFAGKYPKEIQQK